MVFHEIFNSTATWKIYECDQITCDLSNWFAELLFGIIIGGQKIDDKVQAHLDTSFELPHLHDLHHILFFE